jgi:hypothetical protein
MISDLVNALSRKKREFVKNLEKSRNKCLSDATAQTKSSVAAMISIILNRKKFVFNDDKIIWSWVFFSSTLSLMTCQLLNIESISSLIHVISSSRSNAANVRINVECKVASSSVDESSVLRSYIKISLTIESLSRDLDSSWTRFISLIILCRTLLWKMRSVSSRYLMSTW